MATPTNWQLEYKITVGNILTLIAMLGAATVGYTDLRVQIHALNEASKAIPSIEARVSGIEGRGAQARTERAQLQDQVDKMEAKVDAQAEKLALILETVARIDERVQIIIRGK